MSNTRIFAEWLTDLLSTSRTSLGEFLMDKPLDAIGFPLGSLIGKHDFKLSQESDGKQLVTEAERAMLNEPRGERRERNLLKEAKESVRPDGWGDPHPLKAIRLI